MKKLKVLLVMGFIMSVSCYAIDFNLIYGIGAASFDSSISNVYTKTTTDGDTTTTITEMKNLEKNKVCQGTALRVGLLSRFMKGPIAIINGEFNVGIGAEYNYFAASKSDYSVANIPVYVQSEIVFMKDNKVKPLFYALVGVNSWSMGKNYNNFSKSGLGAVMGWGAGLEINERTRVVLDYKWNYMEQKGADKSFDVKYANVEGTKKETISNEAIGITGVYKF